MPLPACQEEDQEIWLPEILRDTEKIEDDFRRWWVGRLIAKIRRFHALVDEKVYMDFWRHKSVKWAIKRNNLMSIRGWLMLAIDYAERGRPPIGRGAYKYGYDDYDDEDEGE